MVILLGLASAALLALGYVLQQHEAAQTSGSLLSPKLLLRLARRPVWLGGIGAMVVGQLLGAAALGLGSIVLVEPLSATNVLFALPIGARWSRRRPGRGEIAGAALLVAGLTVFLAGAAPPSSVDTNRVRGSSWLVASLAVAFVALLLVRFANGRSASREATLFAGAAGVAFGLQDVLTQGTVNSLGHGVGALLTSPEPWLLLVVAIGGLTLSQSAFELAPLSSSLPIMNVAEPACGIVLAVVLLGQRVSWDAGALAAGVCGLLMMIAGVWLVARSPLVADPYCRLTPRSELEPVSAAV